LLSSVIGMPFIGPRAIPEHSLPGMLRVRHHGVHDALRFLKANNPIYHDIEISETCL
ncbi:hypothetical protein FPV67DRAFT_1358325, partial [Lyophyllum atratum]